MSTWLTILVCLIVVFIVLKIMTWVTKLWIKISLVVILVSIFAYAVGMFF